MQAIPGQQWSSAFAKPLDDRRIILFIAQATTQCVLGSHFCSVNRMCFSGPKDAVQVWGWGRLLIFDDDCCTVRQKLSRSGHDRRGGKTQGDDGVGAH